jgi:prophage regulatory protein
LSGFGRGWASSGLAAPAKKESRKACQRCDSRGFFRTRANERIDPTSDNDEFKFEIVAGAVTLTARVEMMKFDRANKGVEQSRDDLPKTGFVRLAAILAPAGPIPVGRSTWWAGVKSGRFPKPVKLGPRTTAWKVEDIRDLIEKAG